MSLPSLVASGRRLVGTTFLDRAILWEEILQRFPRIELLREPERTYSVFVKGYETLPVIIPERL